MTWLDRKSILSSREVLVAVQCMSAVESWSLLDVVASSGTLQGRLTQRLENFCSARNFWSAEVETFANLSAPQVLTTLRQSEDFIASHRRLFPFAAGDKSCALRRNSSSSLWILIAFKKTIKRCTWMQISDVPVTRWWRFLALLL